MGIFRGEICADGYSGFNHADNSVNSGFGKPTISENHFPDSTTLTNTEHSTSAPSLVNHCSRFCPLGAKTSPCWAFEERKIPVLWVQCAQNNIPVIITKPSTLTIPLCLMKIREEYPLGGPVYMVYKGMKVYEQYMNRCMNQVGF